MLSRRNFNLGLGACGLYLLTGCDRGNQSSSGSQQSSSQQSSGDNTIVETAIDIAAIFWNNPVVKLLRFLKIISAPYAQAQHNGNLSAVRFDTTNPKVSGTVNLADSDENASCNFSTPKGAVYLSPAHFMRVNDISLGDDGRLGDVDSKLLAIYTQCTDDVLNSGEGEQNRMLELRAQCFEIKGYGQVNLDYIKVKHETYAI